MSTSWQKNCQCLFSFLLAMAKSTGIIIKPVNSQHFDAWELSQLVVKMVYWLFKFSTLWAICFFLSLIILGDDWYDFEYLRARPSSLPGSFGDCVRHPVSGKAVSMFKTCLKIYKPAKRPFTGFVSPGQIHTCQTRDTSEDDFHLRFTPKISSCVLYGSVSCLPITAWLNEYVIQLYYKLG